MKKVLATFAVIVLLCSTLSALAASGDMYDLSLFEYRTVSSKGRGSLIFQELPRGEFLYDYKYYDGDQIFVNM